MRHYLKLLLAPVMLLVLAACVPSAGTVNTKYILTTDMQNGKFVYLGVGGDIGGQVNPDLQAAPGERITVVLINGDDGSHDIVFPELGVRSDSVSDLGETTSLTLLVPDRETTLAYQDSSHAQLGMKGALMVGALQATADPGPAPAEASSQASVLAAFQKGGCAACHVIPGVPGASGTIGPDLSEIGELAKERIDNGTYKGSAKTPTEYMMESMEDPDAFVAPNCPSGPCPKGVMPNNLAQTLKTDEMQAVADYLAGLPQKLPVKVHAVPEEIDHGVAKLKLASMGVGIDTLTDEQREYLASWKIGT